MIESLKTILEGSATSIKNREYLSTKAYIEPFVDRLKPYTTKFICLVKPADQLSYDDKGVDIIYNRVLIMAVFPDKDDISVNRNEKLISYHRAVCMAYALDVKTPICKFYTGVVDRDLVFYAFGADCINIQKIEPDTPLDYTPIQNIITNGLGDNCQVILSQNETLSLDKDKMTEKLGDWIDFTIKKEYVNDSGRIKLSTTIPIEAYKSLMINRDSDYFVDGDKIPMPEILKSFLIQVSSDDKDIINRYEKTQLVNQLLKL